MKHKPLLFAFSLIFILGAALWGVNTRLNHPPLSNADKEFRALVASADSVKVSQWNCFGCQPCFATYEQKLKTLNSEQTRELIENLRLRGQSSTTRADCTSVPIELRFMHKNEVIVHCKLEQTSRESHLVLDAYSMKKYKLHPRFERPLRQFLDQIAPKRIRP